MLKCWVGLKLTVPSVWYPCSECTEGPRQTLYSQKPFYSAVLSTSLRVRIVSPRLDLLIKVFRYSAVLWFGCAANEDMKVSSLAGLVPGERQWGNQVLQSSGPVTTVLLEGVGPVVRILGRELSQRISPALPQFPMSLCGLHLLPLFLPCSSSLSSSPEAECYPASCISL